MLAAFHLNLGKFLGVCGHDEFRLLLNFIGLRNFPLLSKVLPESAAGQVVNLFCYEQGQKSFVTIVKITRKNLTKNSFFHEWGKERIPSCRISPSYFVSVIMIQSHLL